MKAWLLSFALFSSVVANASSYSEFSTELAESYKLEEHRNYKEAIAVLAKSLKRHPDSYILNLRLGYLFLTAGITANALEHYSKAAEIEPKSIEAWSGVLAVNAAKARWVDAVSTAEKIIQIAPGNYNAGWNLVRAKIMLGKYDDGLEEAKKLLKLYPSDQTLLVQKAVCLEYSKKTTEAKAAYQNVLAVYPTDVTAKAAAGTLK